MTAPTVRADYEALAAIAQLFLGTADNTHQALSHLNQRLDVLRGGDWVGAGATAFYREMDSEVLPTVKRLEQALTEAGRLMREVSRVMAEAEEDAAALFRLLGTGGAGQSGLGESIFDAVFQPLGGATVIPVYLMRGRWGFGSPVHEALTMVAVRKALESVPADQRGELLRGVALDRLPSLNTSKSSELDPKNADPSVQQFLRGVAWPDDPQGYMFDDPRSTENYSTGRKWYNEFSKGDPTDPRALIARSHNGDLQYFHGMSGVENENPQATKTNMLNWSRFLTDVSTGRIDPDVRVSQVPLTQELFPANGNMTLKELFGHGGATDLETRQRAAGALTHMVQDSYAAGHVDRNLLTGDIVQFHTYASQDHDLHGESDQWGAGRTLADRFQTTQGARSAYEQSARVLVMLDQGASTDSVVQYLDQQVFRLDPGVRPSGPGNQFLPRKPATQKV